jgi:cathepsin F
MKGTVLLCGLVVLAAFLQVALSTGNSGVHQQELGMFKQFMEKHNKQYASQDEFNTRFEIFKKNVKFANALNSMGSSARFGVTKFSDLSPQEFKQKYLSALPQIKDDSFPVLPEVSAAELAAIPDSWDWRQKGAVTPIKDQGQCGSCWAFSTVGNVEGQWFLAGNKLTGLSEQNLVDCDTVDQGCGGGLMSNAFQYIIKNGGIDTEASYPYLGVDSTCQFKASNIGAKISNWTMIPSDEAQMANYLYKQGPVSIAVDAQLWQYYIEGIFDFYFCGSTLDHGVLIVAYGHGENFLGEDTDFWTIKNSWGADWGESGYIRLERGENLCGVNLFPCTSFVH